MRNAQSEQSADAIVVGAGCIGLSIARALSMRKLKTVVIERSAAPGAEASRAAAGMIAPQVESDRRDEFFDLACASRDLYPEFASALREETGVNIEFNRTGTIYVGLISEDEDEMQRRHFWQASASLEVERLSPKEARELEPGISPEVRLALRFPRDGQVENRRLITALANSCRANGVKVITGTEVTSVRAKSGRVSGVNTSDGFVSSGTVVIAAGAWSSLIELDNALGRCIPPIEPVRGQMLCFDARPQLVRHVIYSPRGYLVPRADGRLLAGSTVEHAGYNKCMTADGVSQITQNALEIAPSINSLPLVSMWSGLRPKSADGLPVIGPAPDISGLFYAMGHYRNGILLTPITAEIVSECILDQTTPEIMKAFSPARLNRETVKLEVDAYESARPAENGSPNKPLWAPA